MIGACGPYNLGGFATTTDQEAMFISMEFKSFATSTGFKLLNSSPYYTQANGQVEASNQTLIKLIKKKIIDRPRKWQLTLNESLRPIGWHATDQLSALLMN